MRMEYVVLLMVFAGYLSFSMWTEHRLDTLRKERVEFEERIVGAQAALAAAEERFLRESDQARIVHRARTELGFVDAEIGTRVRLALPSSPTLPEEPMLTRLAGGLDRFGGVREAIAGEER
jgi:hypothetical protein